MKKLICLLIAFLLPICGCTQNENKHDTFLNTFLLTDMTLDGVSTPAIFNPAKGTTTPLCSDPLCDHTEKMGCPFAGYSSMGDLHYYDNAIWYLSRVDASLADSKIMRYDMDNAKVSSLCALSNLAEYVPDDISRDNGFGYEFYDGYFRYSIRSADMTTAFQLRLHLDSGKIEVLDKDYRYPLVQYKGYSLTGTPEMDYTGVSYGFIKTDESGNAETILADRRIQITFDDFLGEGKLVYGDVYLREDGKYDLGHMSLRMYDLESGEDHLIMEEFPDVYIAMCGEWIYHVLEVENPPIIGYDRNNSKDKYNASGGILWRTNIYTGECEMAFELPDYLLIGTDIDRVGKYIIIGYQNTDYETYTEEVTNRGIWYNYAKESGRIVYDTVSGTVAVYADVST